MLPIAQSSQGTGLDFKIMAFYGKPLIANNLLPYLNPASLEADVKKALKMLNRSVLVRLRAAIQATAYSAKARKLLASAVSISIKKNSLVVSVNHPAFKPLIMGQKQQQMTWLTKARAPIPIVLDSGEVIFRTATARSMANGSWVHPGRPSTGIVERVKEEARKAIKQRISADIRRQLREAMFR